MDGMMRLVTQEVEAAFEAAASKPSNAVAELLQRVQALEQRLQAHLDEEASAAAAKQAELEQFRQGVDAYYAKVRAEGLKGVLRHLGIKPSSSNPP